MELDSILGEYQVIYIDGKEKVADPTTLVLDKLEREVPKGSVYTPKSLDIFTQAQKLLFEIAKKSSELHGTYHIYDR